MDTLTIEVKHEIIILDDNKTPVIWQTSCLQDLITLYESMVYFLVTFSLELN